MPTIHQQVEQIVLTMAMNIPLASANRTERRGQVMVRRLRSWQQDDVLERS